ncbi:MAG: succinyl-diaminopimelate desuccinylase [Pseudomonadota bacterium]
MTEQLSRSAEILRELIRCPSVTPEEGGALAYLETELKKLGFTVDRVIFSDEDTPDVENLYARYGDAAPHVMFAGHTDVVPVGDEADWGHGPFSGDVEDGIMIGRGAVDMKGGIACFLAAVEAFLAKGEAAGSISFLITGDEEGPSVNGTDKLLKWAADKGETWDAAIVGEPSNSNAIGDTIKNGRRGSLSGRVTVNGVQGHSAYPHLADNPVRGLTDLLNALLETPFDQGTEYFQPTNLEVTSVDVGNAATNVIAAKAVAAFNVRFNDTWDGETMRAEITRRFSEGAKAAKIRQGKDTPVDFDIEWVGRVSPVFLTEQQKLVGTLSGSIEAVTGNTPTLSTGGGTSDARFIKDYCPVVEFGLVGQTMHQVNECTPLADLDTLTAVYSDFLATYFSDNT